MILFEKDLYEQGGHIDVYTKNLSFVKMSLILNQMGIKNHNFFLTTFDKDLIGRDPHNLDDPSVELRQRISMEAKQNFWFFIREVVRVTAAGSGGIPYILNRSNLAQAWLFLNSINSFQVMPRQIGKTIGSMCLALWYIYIAAYHCNWGMFCKGIKLQNENVDRLKKLRDALPKYMLHQTPEDINNKEGIFYKALENGLITFVAQGDKTAAGDQARGQSFAVENWDEIAYYNNIHLSFDAATAGMNQAAEDALKSGVPAAIIITTTAGDIDDPRGRWCYKTVCDAMRFTDKLYDVKDHDELTNLINTNSRNGMVYVEYSHKQLGKDQAWFDRVTRNKDPKVIAKDYLNQWLHGADGSIFSKDLLEKIQKSRKDPVTTTNFESVLIRWYDDPERLMREPHLRMRPYVIGCDTSDMVGRDFTTMCMIDPYDLHIVCTFKCNTSNLLFVARCIRKFLRDFPRSIFIPERNKNGVGFLDFIFADMPRDQFNPLTRIYNMYFQNYTKDTDVRNLSYESGEVRKNFGFTTSKSATSRELLYSKVLMTALRLVGDRLNDSDIINEISGLTMKNGRVDHTEHGHDDLLISYLLAMYFILFGANHQLYGINPDEVMCNVRNDGELIDAEEKKQQAVMRARVNELKALIRRDTNYIVKEAHQRELEELIAVVGDIPEEDNSIKPLDQVQHQATAEARRVRGFSADTILRFC